MTPPLMPIQSSRTGHGKSPAPLPEQALTAESSVVNSASGLGSVSDFLWYGYMPHTDTTRIDAILPDDTDVYRLQQWLADAPRASLFEMAKRRLSDAFDRALKETSRSYVVPLSGGLDSRLIFSELLSRGLRSQMTAVTYGIPGAMDYEIPRILCEREGVELVRIDLRTVAVRASDLEFAFRRGAAGTELITAFYNLRIRELFGDDASVWSGFLGDNLMGSHRKTSHRNLQWRPACTAFADANRWGANPWGVDHGDAILSPRYDPLSPLPTVPIRQDPSLIGYVEQLDLCVRQPSWIEKAIACRDTRVKTPLADPDWARFGYLLPDHERIGQRFYHAFLLNQNPRIFSVKTKSVQDGYLRLRRFRHVDRLARRAFKNSIGRFPPIRRATIRRAYRRRLNYLDFAAAFRDSDKFGPLVQEAVRTLEKNDPHRAELLVNVYADHRQRSDDWSQELLVLVSLAFNLRFSLATAAR